MTQPTDEQVYATAYPLTLGGMEHLLRVVPAKDLRLVMKAIQVSEISRLMGAHVGCLSPGIVDNTKLIAKSKRERDVVRRYFVPYNNGTLLYWPWLQAECARWDAFCYPKRNWPEHIRRGGPNYQFKARYYEYLKSDEWETLRQRVLERDQRLCVRCKSPATLQVHHLTYDRVGEELLEDLETVCDECHREEHGLA